jgi:hypothetical protein
MEGYVLHPFVHQIEYFFLSFFPPTANKYIGFQGYSISSLFEEKKINSAALLRGHKNVHKQITRS